MKVNNDVGKVKLTETGQANKKRQTDKKPVFETEKEYKSVQDAEKKAIEDSQVRYF